MEKSKKRIDKLEESQLDTDRIIKLSNLYCDEAVSGLKKLMGQEL